MKLTQVQTMLERRIRLGDYLLKDMPGERELAEEAGVSRMTVRKAVLNLINTGILQRDTNGRVTMNRKRAEHPARIAFLAPCLSSTDFERWRLALDALAKEFTAVTRTLLYAHWDDPVLLDAIERFDGVFILPIAEPVPGRIVDRLCEAREAVVILGQDMIAQGLRSIRLLPPAATHRLLDLLAELGHRRIDCFNVQHVDRSIEERIDQWKLWRAAHRMPGQLLGQPVQQPASPVTEAFQQMRGILDRDELETTALLCTTASSAIGAVRALHSRGYKVGHDVSICVVNDENIARMFSPSLTSLEMHDPTPYLSLCLTQMQRHHDGWAGSLLMQPTDVPLFIGESTGPPARKPITDCDNVKKVKASL
ncbi:substrate-binding domain-containing protein [Phycisphaerales bacterium AB-hyl4]|uniref:Substrate-binding domain-containing protein n=1 Tax=Natronomicrosphaera hydrolytica TaxID=3242702 RepID=A0ABV4U3F6_9BACT